MAALILLAVAAGTAASQAQIIWGPEERLSDESPRISNGPRLASAPTGDVVLVWADVRDDEWNYEIFIRRWDGLSWRPQERLTFAPAQSIQPDIAVDEHGALHVAWVDLRDGNQEIYYKAGIPGSWGPDQRLSYDPAPSSHPAVIAGGGAVHVFWQDDRVSPTQLYYRKWTTDGWGAETRLTDSPTYAHSCSAAINAAGHVLVLWQTQRKETQMVYASFWDGSAWTHAPLPGDGFASQPTVTCGPTAFHAVIRTYDYGQARLEQSTGDGVSWSPWYRLTEVPANSGFPEISADSSGDLQVVWHDTRTGPEEIFIKVRPFLTGVWSEDEQISTGGEAEGATVACDAAGTIVVAWTDGRDGNAEIYGRHGMVVTGVGPAAVAPPLVAVWPDPSGDWLWVLSPFTPVGGLTVDLLDCAGRLVFRRNVLPDGEAPVRLDLDRGLRPGVYFYSVRADRETITGKVVCTP